MQAQKNYLPREKPGKVIRIGAMDLFFQGKYKYRDVLNRYIFSLLEFHDDFKYPNAHSSET